MTPETDSSSTSSKETPAQPLSSLAASSTAIYQVRVQAEFLELAFDIDTLLGQLQSLGGLSQVGSAN
jgi:hypothetical protein